MVVPEKSAWNAVLWGYKTKKTDWNQPFNLAGTGPPGWAV